LSAAFSFLDSFVSEGGMDIGDVFFKIVFDIGLLSEMKNKRVSDWRLIRNKMRK